MRRTTPSWFVSIDLRAFGLAGAALACVAAAGCAPSRDWAMIEDRTPLFLAGLEARDPAIAADADGRVALTFVTKDSTGTDLWLAISSDRGARFSEPVRVNPQAGGVSSFWEGRPLAAFGPGGRLIVAWSERRLTGHGVDLLTRSSLDGGATLAEPVIVNDDTSGRPVHHGFPALGFAGDGAVIAAWLDERDSPPSEGEPPYSAVYTATSRDGGHSWSANRRVAELVCGCCRPAMLADASGGVVVSYRNARENMRDPMLAASPGGEHGFETFTISTDRWHMEGCPVVGPVLAGDPNRGWYVWYTGADPEGLYLAPWRADRGATGPRRRIDDGLRDATQPRLAGDGNVAWIAARGRASADTARTALAVRRLGPSGLTPWIELGDDADSGWIASSGHGSVFACWVERGGGRSRVRVAEVRRRP